MNLSHSDFSGADCDDLHMINVDLEHSCFDGALMERVS